MSYTPTGDRNRFASLTRVIDKAWGFASDVSKRAIAPLALNNESILALNAAGTGTVELIKADATNAVVAPNGLTIPAGKTLVYAGGITNAQLDPMIEQYATVTLTAAEIIALNTAPKTLIAAPGTGKAILVWGAAV